MFDIFRLSCLDCLIWLRSGKDAAERFHCSQATVSRNANYVAEFLDLDAKILRGSGV